MWRGGVRGQEVLNLSFRCLHPPPPVRLQTFCNLASELLEKALVTRRILAYRESCVKTHPHVLQYSRVFSCLLRLDLGYLSTGVCKESILLGQDGWVTEGELCAPPELIFMFPQGGAAEAPNDQVTIQVVPGVLDGHVPEEMTVPSGTAPHSQSQTCSTSIYIGSRGIGMYGIPPAYPPVLPLPYPLQFICPALLLLGL